MKSISYKYAKALLKAALLENGSVKTDFKPEERALVLLQEEALALEPKFKKYTSYLSIYNRTNPTITIRVKDNLAKGYSKDEVVSNPYYDPNFDIDDYNCFSTVADYLCKELKALGDVTVIDFIFEPSGEEYHSKDVISVIYQI